ncbi:UDP-N-acetylglucosamine transporter [Portunus trituberculatus]|uniref:UDP-N-acetylglucosamine transporter n=1 Tax=Portunus trituberculatus TaxID=210409 RepID=A0A5B7CTU5_PORTR|nr:UDP-N-acetylglucosamine transporter [Portunus trituberculatus]
MSEVDSRRGPGMEGPGENRWLRKHLLSLKTLSLVVLSVQTSTMVLLLRYSRTTSIHQPYIITTAVLMSELLKLALSLCFLHLDSGKIMRVTLKRLYEDVLLNAWETLKLAIPAFLYVVQNNLLFIALSNLDAATYQVDGGNANRSTSKILPEVEAMEGADPSLLGGAEGGEVGEGGEEVHPPDAHNAAHPNTEVRRLLGILAVFVSCISSGFSGVYFERLVKKGKQTSLIIRNIQLGVFSIAFAVMAVSGDSRAIKESGFFQGYSLATWLVVLIQAFGGLMVSVTMKYADNILKGFATSLSIVMSSLVSWLALGDAAPTIQFVIGASIVISSTFLYGVTPQRESEIRESTHHAPSASPHKIAEEKKLT